MNTEKGPWDSEIKYPIYVGVDTTRVLVEALERLMHAARDRDTSTGCQIRLVVAQAELRDAARHAADCLETMRNPEGGE